jgi:hypothetical protein
MSMGVFHVDSDGKLDVVIEEAAKAAGMGPPQPVTFKRIGR